MCWPQRQLTVLMLAVVTGVPVATTVCTALCGFNQHTPVQQTSSPEAHAHCQQRADTAQVSNAADSDCGTHGTAVRDVPATAAPARAHASYNNPVVIALPPAPSLVRTASDVASTLDAPPGWGSGPTPLVLRV